MKRKQKKAVKSLFEKPSSRKSKRMMKRESGDAACKEAMMNIVDHLSKDRSEYVQGFFTFLDNGNAVVEETIAALQDVTLPEISNELWLQIVKPYEPFVIIAFCRLMDHLTVDEEVRLRETAARSNDLWSAMFTSYAIGRNEDLARYQPLLECHRRLQESLVLLFTGELPPTLTPEIIEDIKTLVEATAFINGLEARA